MARQRYGRGAIRPSGNSHCKFIHAICTRSRTSGTGRRYCQESRGEGRMFRCRIQHYSNRRRNSHGPRRHAIFATLARTDCKLCRVHGESTLRRCHGVYIELRQGDSRYAYGCHATQYTGHLCFRRPNGSRHGRWRSRGPCRCNGKSRRRIGVR